jgi:hypothetical protein
LLGVASLNFQTIVNLLVKWCWVHGEASLNDWWLTAKLATPKCMCKGLASATLLTAWMLWKQRNSCICDNDQPFVGLLSDIILEEAALWAKAGAAGPKGDHPNHLGRAPSLVKNVLINLLGGMYPFAFQSKETHNLHVFSTKKRSSCFIFGYGTI